MTPSPSEPGRPPDRSAHSTRRAAYASLPSGAGPPSPRAAPHPATHRAPRHHRRTGECRRPQSPGSDRCPPQRSPSASSAQKSCPRGAPTRARRCPSQSRWPCRCVPVWDRRAGPGCQSTRPATWCCRAGSMIPSPSALGRLLGRSAHSTRRAVRVLLLSGLGPPPPRAAPRPATHRAPSHHRRTGGCHRRRSPGSGRCPPQRSPSASSAPRICLQATRTRGRRCPS